MAFCKYCGKEIPEGSVCSCEEAQAETSSAAPTQTSVTNETNGGSQASNPVADVISSIKNGNSNMTVLIAAGAAVLLAIIILICVLCSGGYKKPFNKVVKGFNKEDPEIILSAFFTEDMIESGDEWDGDYDDAIDDFDDAMDEMIDALEDKYGKDLKIKFDIDSKKPIKEGKLEDFEDEYDDEFDMDVEIKKGYKIKGTISIEGSKDDDEIDDIEISVIKIKGEGWVIYPFDMSLSSLYRYMY